MQKYINFYYNLEKIYTSLFYKQIFYEQTNDSNKFLNKFNFYSVLVLHCLLSRLSSKTSGVIKIFVMILARKLKIFNIICNKPYPDASFRKVRTASYLLPSRHVRISVPHKCHLQIL